ncbi:MAG: Iron-sulfur cluster assembly scaffold protein IscU/NifU-like [Firmicutes bacterium]|nr:Iron-sulfur cluster assembly scaffold protein IscU/NifU-like [Bacillota bacterium]MDI6705973.1 iron-sulfur cluster assembly scaffold protein [Bacillota bacterium]
MYSEEVMKLFSNPENWGIIEDADGIGEAGTSDCGDYLVIFLKVDEEERISDIKFQVYGCCSAIATSSMTTILAKGKTVEQALRITEEDIVDALGGLPEEKVHCSLLGVAALNAAIEDYRSRKGD